MNTLRQFAGAQVAIPASTAWYLTDLGEFRGKQELYTRQSPQRLKAIREHALIESAVSSNRIEGVAVDPSRVREVFAAPKPLFRDRDEEEVRGYCDALAWIHAEATGIPVNEQTIKRLHALARGQIWDAGHYWRGMATSSNAIWMVASGCVSAPSPPRRRLPGREVGSLVDRVSRLQSRFPVYPSLS